MDEDTPTRGTQEEGGQNSLDPSVGRKHKGQPPREQWTEGDERRLHDQRERQSDRNAEDAQAAEAETARRGTPVVPPQPHAGISHAAGGRGLARSHQGQGAVPPPPPMDDRQASVEARVRTKLSRGEPLDEEERRFLATLPGDRSIPPSEVQDDDH